jgi:DNA polymerase III alpha subunit (gram-positive type)
MEMTGLDVKKHEIIEVAALKVTQPKFDIESSYYAKVKPSHIKTADPASLEVLGYSPRDWTEAITRRQTLLDLSELAPNSILVGWGIQSEWDFLVSALESEKLPYFFTQVIEVSSIAFYKLYQDYGLDRLGLSKVCKYLNIPLQHHRPDSDIRATYQIFKHFFT